MRPAVTATAISASAAARTDVSYIVAHLAKSQLWHANSLLAGFFLTETCGLRPVHMGWIVGLSLIVNALADLGLGYRWRSAGATARTTAMLQARGAPLVCLFFALFCATGLMPPSIRLAWALVTLIGLRVTYPLLDVPQNALVVLVAPDMHRRGRLLVLRNIASSIAGLTVGLVAAPLLLAPGQMLGYPLWAIGAGGLAWAGAALLARSPLPPAPTPSVATGTSPHGPGFGIVLATLVVMIAASTVFRSMEPYFGAFAGGGAGMLIWAALASIVSQPVWLLLVRRLSPVRVAIVMAGVTGVAAVILLGPIRATPLGVAVTGVAFGAGSSGLWLILWYHLADHAGRGGALWRTGAFTCASKLSQGVAMIWLGTTLELSRYRTALADPLSLPSLAMVAAVLVLVAACLGLAIAQAVSRTGVRGTAATPHPADRTVPAPASLPRWWSPVREGRDARAMPPPASRSRRRSAAPADAGADHRG
jgi:Na+/melibiose symporter-like transporter